MMRFLYDYFRPTEDAGNEKEELEATEESDQPTLKTLFR
jgi:hypothetical protein